MAVELVSERAKSLIVLDRAVGAFSRLEQRRQFEFAHTRAGGNRCPCRLFDRGLHVSAGLAPEVRACERNLGGSRRAPVDAQIAAGDGSGGKGRVRDARREHPGRVE